MFGSFTFETAGDSEALATLEDNGDWTCSNGVYARLLNLEFSAKGHRPQDGYFGFLKVFKAVEFFKGRVIVAPVPKPGPVGNVEY